MRTYCIEWETLLNALGWPKWEKKSKKEGICITDSLCCTAEIQLCKATTGQ